MACFHSTRQTDRPTPWPVANPYTLHARAILRNGNGQMGNGDSGAPYGIDKFPESLENIITMMQSSDPQLDSLKFDSNGLIPVIVQDAANGQVLVMAFANREAIEKTLETGKVHTYSRSRGRLALKGESSGHFQLVKKMLTDCDRDVVLFQVEQIVAACHEGYRSCFFREYQANQSDWKIIAEKAFDPKSVYEK